MTQNWAKWIGWPTIPHNDAQRKISEIDRAIREGRREPLRFSDVYTSEREIVEMTAVVETFGHSPERFLEILHQDSDAFGVEPADVYATGRMYEEPSWPEDGFGMTIEELDWLTEVCCDVTERATLPSDDEYTKSPFERLAELCEFLSYAQEIGVPPSITRGDQ